MFNLAQALIYRAQSFSQNVWMWRKILDVKTKAFAKMFRHYGPEVEKAVVEYHLVNGGVSRFKKFEYYYKNFLQKPINQDILNAFGQESNHIALEGVLAVPFIDGALETLKQLKQQGIPVFMVSGTPDEEIKIIVEKRNIAFYFMEVHGSPLTKQEIVRDIAGRYGYQLGKCLFIGDATTDYEAARVCGTMFLGLLKIRKNLRFQN